MANKPAGNRMCITCRKGAPGSSMIRICRTPSGEARIDTEGRCDGRGAYLCRDRVCIEKAQAGRRIERALSCRVPEELYEKLGELYA